jgi:hypothetical protein
MGGLTDQRKRRDYNVAELVTAGIALFIFKEDSRHAFNLVRRDEQFSDNYLRIFKLRLPQMDTVHAFLRDLPDNELEGLKAALVAGLINQRVLHRFKLFGKYFTIAVDGTGTNTYTENNEEGSRIHKTSKNQVTTYYDYVLEAKLVTSSGLAISLATEWVHNESDRNFDKQDCEHKAFKRLAEKIKKHFPRLPVCILADGLYPNQTFMGICRDNGWAYVVVLQDESLKTLQEDIIDVENKHRHSTDHNIARRRKHTHQKYEWVSAPLSYAEHTVYWLSCRETELHYDKKGKLVLKDKEPKTGRFVFLTNHAVDKDNVCALARAGRRRWNIEDGFNTQKNRGYNLGHKFSRKSFTAYKNYFQCMQIAHAINQLVEHSSNVAALCIGRTKLTIKHLWGDLIAYLKMIAVEQSVLEVEDRFQIRLEG